MTTFVSRMNGVGDAAGMRVERAVDNWTKASQQDGAEQISISTQTLLRATSNMETVAFERLQRVQTNSGKKRGQSEPRVQTHSFLGLHLLAHCSEQHVPASM